MISQLQSKRVYFDANILMYLFEGFEAYESVLQNLLEGFEQKHFEAITSDLTLAELLAGPLKAGNTELAERYRRYLEQDEGIKLSSITRSDFIQAAVIRAQTGLKLPDSLHLASAISSECDVMLTNDKRIHSTPECHVVQLSDLQ